MTQEKFFNADLSKEEFLKDFWNKKPCLFKKAFQNTESLAGKEDFFELAMDPECETRLVYKGEKQKRKLVHGPFEAEDLNQLTQKPFALIAHNLNALAPEFYEFEKAVDFVPKWEFDDVMAVCSSEGMSLGAHIDNYNVFIFQGAGRRKWQIQLEPNKTFKKNEEIKELEEFIPDFDWMLEPGDMIYIPPHVAHHGISLTESISYSIGFRALESYETLRSYLDHLFENKDSPFCKGKEFNAASKSDLDPYAIEFLQKEMKRLSENRDELRDFLVSHLSSPKYPIALGEEKLPPKWKEKKFQRDVQLKYVLARLDDGRFLLGINQKNYKINENQKNLLLPLLDSSPFETFSLPKELSSIEAIVEDLLSSGAIFICE